MLGIAVWVFVAVAGMAAVAVVAAEGVARVCARVDRWVARTDPDTGLSGGVEGP
jgi:hypothetical protein